MTDFLQKWWAEMILGVLVAAVTTQFKRLHAMRNGMRALLRDRIIQACNHRMDQGWCPTYALDSILDMYEQYHALGGNGAVANLVSQVKALPSKAG